jgi:diacylglycerol kinase (ATP)
LSRATLIYNPVAGRNPARRAADIRVVVEVLRGAGFDLEVSPTTGPGSARGLACAAVAADTEAVIVCGGDGTLNEVANGLALGHCPIAILPGGTANIAAKDLGIPHDLTAAARQLTRVRPQRIALGRVRWHGAKPRSRYFLSIAGVGFDAYVVHSLPWEFKSAFGVGAYCWEAIRQVWRYRFPRFVCQNGKGEWRGTMGVFQRTERYAGWLHLAPGASLFSDRMKLCLFAGRGPWRYSLYATAVALRRHVALPDVWLVEGSSVTCSAEDALARIYLELDGELAGELPATFDVVPDALTLLLPEETGKHAGDRDRGFGSRGR